MDAAFDLSHVDFRTTPFENLFLDTYLAHAPEQALRAYLAGWKLCHTAAAYAAGEQDLATLLDISPEEVQKAMAYWISEGLVTEETPGSGQYRFHSMLLAWAGINDRPAPEARRDLPPLSGDGDAASASSSGRNEETGRADPSTASPFPGTMLLSEQSTANSARQAAANAYAPQNASDRTNRQTAPGSGESKPQAISDLDKEAMFDRLEDFLSAGLSYRVVLKENEIRLILSLFDRYPFTPQYFLYAYQKAAESKEAGARSVNYIATIVENWARFDGITTIETLDAAMEKAKTASRPRRSRKRKSEYVQDDKRMTREEEAAWVRRKLEESRTRSLRGGSDDQSE